MSAIQLIVGLSFNFRYGACAIHAYAIRIVVAIDIMRHCFNIVGTFVYNVVKNISEKHENMTICKSLLHKTI